MSLSRFDCVQYYMVPGIFYNPKFYLDGNRLEFFHKQKEKKAETHSPFCKARIIVVCDAKTYLFDAVIKLL